jgi:hypothetical protein
MHLETLYTKFLYNYLKNKIQLLFLNYMIQKCHLLVLSRNSTLVKLTYIQKIEIMKYTHCHIFKDNITYYSIIIKQNKVHKSYTKISLWSYYPE